MALDLCVYDFETYTITITTRQGTKLNPEQSNYFFHGKRKIYCENGIALVNQYFWLETSICCCITLLSASFFFVFFFVPWLLPLTPLLLRGRKMSAVLFGAKPAYSVNFHSF